METPSREPAGPDCWCPGVGNLPAKARGSHRGCTACAGACRARAGSGRGRAEKKKNKFLITNSNLCSLAVQSAEGLAAPLETGGPRPAAGHREGHGVAMQPRTRPL